MKFLAAFVLCAAAAVAIKRQAANTARRARPILIALPIAKIAFLYGPSPSGAPSQKSQ